MWDMGCGMQEGGFMGVYAGRREKLVLSSSTQLRAERPGVEAEAEGGFVRGSL